MELENEAPIKITVLGQPYSYTLKRDNSGLLRAGPCPSQLSAMELGNYLSHSPRALVVLGCRWGAADRPWASGSAHVYTY